MGYAEVRGWVRQAWAEGAYRPLDAVTEDTPLERLRHEYVWWWRTIAYRQEGYAVGNLGGSRVIMKPSAARE